MFKGKYLTILNKAYCKALFGALKVGNIKYRGVFEFISMALFCFILLALMLMRQNNYSFEYVSYFALTLLMKGLLLIIIKKKGMPNDYEITEEILSRDYTIKVDIDQLEDMAKFEVDIRKESDVIKFIQSAINISIKARQTVTR